MGGPADQYWDTLHVFRFRQSQLTILVNSLETQRFLVFFYVVHFLWRALKTDAPQGNVELYGAWLSQNMIWWVWPPPPTPYSESRFSRVLLLNVFCPEQ
jgi:hypothetical protein